MPSSSPSPFRRRVFAAFTALACAAVASLPHAAAQPTKSPKPTPTTKAGAKGAPSASSTAAVIETIEGSDEVQKLYMEGDDAFKRAAYQEADALFTKAWAQSKSFDVAGRLGETKRELGKLREAAQYLSFALRNALPSTRASRRDALKKDLDAVKEKLATIKLTVSLVEAKIAIDGAALDPLFFGPEVFIEPGKHTFEATAEGYETAKQTVDGKPGEILVVSLTLDRAVPKPPPGAAPTATPGTPLPAALLGAGGGVFVVLGAVLVGVAESRKTEAYNLAAKTIVDGRRTCPKQGPGPTETCDKVRAAASDVDLFGNIGVGAFIAGGVLIGAAAGYMLFFTPSTKPPASAEPPKTGKLVPLVGPNGGGLLFTGSF